MARLVLLAPLLFTACSDDSSISADARAPDAQLSDQAATDQATDQTATDQTATDGTTEDGPAVDAGGKPDGPRLDSSTVDGSYPPLFKDLEGIWLVGWGGGMNHYSWVRFTVTSSFGGTAVILDGKTLTVNLPYWNCNGPSSWNLASKPDTIQLHFPSSTCVPQGLKSSSYTFSNIKPASSWPKGATHTAQVTTFQQPTNLEGYKFPPSQCNAAMTSCTDPL
jgi:hypothetical protein